MCMFMYVRIYTCRWIMFICVKMYMCVGGFMFMYMSTCVCVWTCRAIDQPSMLSLGNYLPCFFGDRISYWVGYDTQCLDVF